MSSGGEALQEQAKIRIPDTPTLALFQCPASQEKLEEDLQPVRRREDPELPGPGVCPSPLQTHPAVFHGRDRRRPRLQKRLHRSILHLCKFLGASSSWGVPSSSSRDKVATQLQPDLRSGMLEFYCFLLKTFPKTVSYCQNTQLAVTAVSMYPSSWFPKVPCIHTSMSFPSVSLIYSLIRFFFMPLKLLPSPYLSKANPLHGSSSDW